MFFNLLQNAIVYAFEGPPLRISITADNGPVMRTFDVVVLEDEHARVRSP